MAQFKINRLSFFLSIFTSQMLHRVRNSLHRKQTPKCLHGLKTTSLSSFLQLLHFPSSSTIFLASARVICPIFKDIQQRLKEIIKVIDGLQLRHSFFPPKRLDVKTPLQSIGSYRKSSYNSFSGHIERIWLYSNTFVDSLALIESYQERFKQLALLSGSKKIRFLWILIVHCLLLPTFTGF